MLGRTTHVAVDETIEHAAPSRNQYGLWTFIGASNCDRGKTAGPAECRPTDTDRHGRRDRQAAIRGGGLNVGALLSRGRRSISAAPTRGAAGPDAWPIMFAKLSSKHWYRAVLRIARNMLSQDVRLSVRQCRYSVETAKHILKLFFTVW